MNTESSADGQTNGLKALELTLAHLAIEYWKLLRSFEKANDLAQPDAKARLAAQARYAAGRLDALLSDARMRLVVFDGLPFEINLPAIAINGEDMTGLVEPIVERTIEPAVVSGMNVLVMGKVFLGKPTERGDKENVPGH